MTFFSELKVNRLYSCDVHIIMQYMKKNVANTKEPNLRYKQRGLVIFEMPLGFGCVLSDVAQASFRTRHFFCQECIYSSYWCLLFCVYGRRSNGVATCTRGCWEECYIIKELKWAVQNNVKTLLQSHSRCTTPLFLFKGNTVNVMTLSIHEIVLPWKADTYAISRHDTLYHRIPYDTLLSAHVSWSDQSKVNAINRDCWVMSFINISSRYQGQMHLHTPKDKWIRFPRHM